MAGWMYRRGADGSVEAHPFAGAPVPDNEGWVDTPAKCGQVKYPHHTPAEARAAVAPQPAAIAPDAERAALTARVGDGAEPMKSVDTPPAPVVVTVEAPRPVAPPTQARKGKR